MAENYVTGDLRMRATVVKRVSLDAAHFLPGYEGKCANMHGHRWVVELGVSGEVDPDTGMVIDFGELSAFLKEKVVERFDHHLINDVIENPTAECIALRIRTSWVVWSEENCLAVGLSFLRVWETEDSYAEVRDE